MGRVGSSYAADFLHLGKTSASSPRPSRTSGFGNGDDSASGDAALVNHAHGRFRGQEQELCQGGASRACNGKKQHALGLCKSMAGPESALTILPPLAKDGSLCNADHVQVGHAGGWRNRHSWEDDSGFPGRSAYGALGCVPLRQPPPPLFLGVRLPPWCRSASPAAYPLSEDGLTSELMDFSRYLQLTPHEEVSRARLLDYVQACVEELWGPFKIGCEPGATARVILYGSYAFGLSLPSSDIDVALTFPAEEAEDAARGSAEEGRENRASAALRISARRQALHLERLRDLARQLRKSAAFSALEVEIHDQCRVPRIHLRGTTRGGVSCDITTSFVSARVACIVARQRLWLQDSPLAVFLVRITKAAVKQWGLNEVFSGGLASTALYCLVLRFLAQMEQLCQHAQVEENLSPPRYEEAATTSATAFLPSPPQASLPPLPELSIPHSARGSCEAPIPTFTSATWAGRGGDTLIAAAAVPSYVPSWAVERMKYSLGKSTSLRDVKEDNALGLSGKTACSLSQWGRVRSACQEDKEADDEVDGYTQAGLSLSSGATTTATTPTAYTSACALSSSASDSHEGGAASVSATAIGPAHVDPAAKSESELPSAQELTRLAQARYGASPGRLLLKLWRFLSDDAFVTGYQVADAFGDDLVWCNGGEGCGLNVGCAQLPLMSSLEQATFASTASSDLSAATFRLPELLSLFRHSSASLEDMLWYQRYPWRTAPTMLSTVFVDPRLPTAS
ncbi:hypothetical protein LSCM1_00430 [Leishmania martiniquensis]|uniref:Poly(A) RNA polymerase mitochondrial-like central palm domain-containing protein n=1 Tax=Leishmania martiniquensis TaxID=1580590 RepID=A0A836G156_9TRYP|nr:hypothetical protein LSCM1_00430 [Leishmania martiniquensis]